MKQALYQRVSQAMGVDPSRREQRPTSSSSSRRSPIRPRLLPRRLRPRRLPAAEARHTATTPWHPAPRAERAEGTRRSPLAPFPTETSGPSTPSATQQTASKPSSSTVDDRERALALQGTPDSKVLFKRQPRATGHTTARRRIPRFVFSSALVKISETAPASRRRAPRSRKSKSRRVWGRGVRSARTRSERPSQAPRLSGGIVHVIDRCPRGRLRCGGSRTRSARRAACVELTRCFCGGWR